MFLSSAKHCIVLFIVCYLLNISRVKTITFQYQWPVFNNGFQYTVCTFFVCFVTTNTYYQKCIFKLILWNYLRYLPPTIFGEIPGECACMYMWVGGIDFDFVFFILWLDYGMLGVFCISFFVMCLVIPVFPASLNCPFVIAPLLSLVYAKCSMHNVQDYSVLYNNLFARLYVRVRIWKILSTTATLH